MTEQDEIECLACKKRAATPTLGRWLGLPAGWVRLELAEGRLRTDVYHACSRECVRVADNMLRMADGMCAR